MATKQTSLPASLPDGRQIMTPRQIRDTERSLIANINGVEFGTVYPILTATNKAVSYYSPDLQREVHLFAPYLVRSK